MKTTPIFPRIIAMSVFAGIGLLASTGCVSSKYKEAKKDTPPPHLLNVPFPPASLEATLNTLVTYNGPGSWKRNAFWDEYVVTCHNPGRAPLTVSAATLTDFADASRSPGSKPWALEKESKNLEQKYKEAGLLWRARCIGIFNVRAPSGPCGTL